MSDYRKKVDAERADRDRTYDTAALIERAIRDKGKPFAQAFHPDPVERRDMKQKRWAMDGPDDPAERAAWEKNRERLRRTQCPPGWAIRKQMEERNATD